MKFNTTKIRNSVFIKSLIKSNSYFVTMNPSVKLFSTFISNHSDLTRKERIKKIITSEFEPEHLEIINESHKHSLPNSETHFKLIIVSKFFENKSQISIHQSIYKLLSSEMGEKSDNKLHALSLVTKSPKEWEKIKQNEFSSPSCMNRV